MRTKHYCVLAFLLLFTLSAQADFQLDNAASTLNFISIKKDKVGEVHTFKQLQGSIAGSGEAQVTIGLTSVETNIAIRNERMNKLLLETGMFPTARVSTTLDMTLLETSVAGQATSAPVELTLDLHGASKVILSDLRVIGLADGALLVSTVNPIMLSATDFGLDAGILKLAEVAKLPSIASVVPVTFSLVFRP